MFGKAKFWKESHRIYLADTLSSSKKDEGEAEALLRPYARRFYLKSKSSLKTD